MSPKLIFRLVFFCALSASGSIDRSACLPDTPEARGWPVAGIYMHGLFEPSGNTAYRGMEKTNRQLIEKYIKDNGLKVRIAVPVSPVTGKYHQWIKSKTSVKSVEKSAVDACGGGRLLDGRVLFAFSNGANAAEKFSCDATEAYSHVMIIGANSGGGGKSCGQSPARFESYRHDFPAAFSGYKKYLGEFTGGALKNEKHGSKLD